MKTAAQGLIVTAAFIGPGTITTATIVGAELGFQILWALLFSITATCCLQLMAFRLGKYSQMGLAQASLSLMPNPLLKLAMVLLIVTAIVVGNAAYESGNLTGAAIGLSAVSDYSTSIWVGILGLSAALVLISGKHQIVERLLVVLVVCMALVFIALAFIVDVNYVDLAKGFIPSSITNITLVLALIGTTIVPYNLFLQSSMAASEHTTDNKSTVESSYEKTQLFASFGLGGLVTLAIISSAASAFFAQQLEVNPSNISLQLEPLLGENAAILFAMGLFAAGLTSAITAPLAASYVVSEACGWQRDLASWRFKSVSLVIIAIGTALGVSGIKPLELIIVAQSANALLLPIAAALLLFACNQSSLMGQNTNHKSLNVIAGLTILLVSGLSIAKFI